MENDKLNWPLNSVEEMISWASDEAAEYEETGSQVHSTMAKLEYMEAIAQALVEIRDELRRWNDGKVE